MFPFALKIIFLLFFLGGIIAYVGNYVGKYIGKRRLTMFNLRPRHTATAITVISGILIAATTLGIVLLVSQDARTTLLGLEGIKKELGLKTSELNAANGALGRLNQELAAKQQQLVLAKNEVGKLLDVKTALLKEVSSARKGEIFFKNGGVITVSLIKAGPEREKVEAGLKQVIENAEADEKTVIEVPNENFEQAVDALVGSNKLFVVKLLASRNVFFGENILAKIESQENRLVYKEKELIAEGEIGPSLTSAQIEQRIAELLKNARQIAQAAGVIPDASGVVGSVTYSQIAELAKRIKLNNKKVNVKISAKQDVYSVGPLEVQFKLVYK